MDKIPLALEEAGTSMENIVKVLIYFKDMNDYEVVKQTEFEYWEQHSPGLAAEPPASTVCEVAPFPSPICLWSLILLPFVDKRRGLFEWLNPSIYPNLSHI